MLRNLSLRSGVQLSDRWRTDIHRTWVVVLVLASLVLLPAGSFAASQQVSVGSGEDVLIDLSGDPNDSNDTAVRIKNLSQNSGEVIVDFISGPQGSGADGASVQTGFALVDGTLSVQSNIPAGELRVRYRMEYLRADLRRTGVRANSIRMLRRDVPGARWVRATNSIRRQTPIRYLRDERADFVLGHHGYLREKRYVWAVMDVNSEYAIGGAVPVGYRC